MKQVFLCPGLSVIRYGKQNCMYIGTMVQYTTSFTSYIYLCSVLFSLLKFSILRTEVLRLSDAVLTCFPVQMASQ